MNILVIGGGGREHALVWKLRQSRAVAKLWCVPGNAGIAACAECVPGDPGDVPGLMSVAEKLRPDLTVVGPELPLVKGLADGFARRKWPIVGPSEKAAQLEGSKIFAKEFLARHNIPTAEMYGSYETPGDAHQALCDVNWPVVIKADGLCAGKGVFVAANPDAATNFIERLLGKDELGPSGRRILLEEALEGDELSFIIVTDGQRYAPLVPTRDHKRLLDGNQGPNTGGMGAYSTDEMLSPGLREAITSNVVERTLRGLSQDGIPYHGFLYFGLMLTKSGPKVLEFNCRLGDPETQAIVARMDFDLAEVLADVARGRFEPDKLAWKPGASVCVVLASGGYPGKLDLGKKIEGLIDVSRDTGVMVFHAGTQPEAGFVVTSGGRVLGVTARAPNLRAAVAEAYRAIGRIHFEGMHYRRDIGAEPSRAQAAQD